MFPSTYDFTRHNSCDQVAKRMVRNFRAVWDSIRPPDGQQLPDGLTPLQVVTLASLVERETPDAEERPLVAGVFYNRLRKGVPLQCDPTVQYALALEGHPIKDVKPKDLQVDSPYNTYTHRGLASGPDRESGRGVAASGAGARDDRLPVFCGERPGRPLFRAHARGTQSQRRATATPPECRRSGRGCRIEEDDALRKHVSAEHTHEDSPDRSSTKKALILEAAEALRTPRFTPAEIEQIRRQLIAQLGEKGKTSPDYIVSVLEEAGMRVVWSTRADTEGRYEEEFADLLHFSTLEEAEMCLVRLDELLRKFAIEGRAARPRSAFAKWRGWGGGARK